LRRGAFDVDPLGRAYIANGRSTRVFVRVALQLVKAHGLAANLARGDDDSGRPSLAGFPSETFFVRQANRHIDIVTRYFARYPGEMVSVNMMRAQFHRTIGHGRVSALHDALAKLDEADSMMWAARDRQRVRMRLLLERSKIWRSLALYSKNDSMKQILYYECAQHDWEVLEGISNNLAIPIWKTLTEEARRKLDQLRGELGIDRIGFSSPAYIDQ
jgi:hypothetical protein